MSLWSVYLLFGSAMVATVGATLALKYNRI
jgi:hypothetical protein